MEPYESIQMPWYNVLGNHDYHSIAVAEEWSERLRSVDSRWICHRDYSVVKTVPGPPGEEPFTVQFFFIDTNPFVTHYQESINECLDTTLPAEEDTDCDGHYNGMKVSHKRRISFHGGHRDPERPVRVVVAHVGCTPLIQVFSRVSRVSSRYVAAMRHLSSCPDLFCRSSDDLRHTTAPCAFPIR